MNLAILTTRIGGGHLSVARSLADGFRAVGGNRCQVRIVDYMAEYAPFPLSRAHTLYNLMVRLPPCYGLLFAAMDTRFGRLLDAQAMAVVMSQGMRRLLHDYSPDVIVATYPLGAPALAGLLYRSRRMVPYYTVVTDYGAVHSWWAYPLGELWFTPCEVTAHHLISAGIPHERVIATGYPVHAGFARPSLGNREARRRLGLEVERFTILVMGGAEGVGPLEEVVRALAVKQAPWQLDVITGRNRRLHERLTAAAGEWAIPVRVQGLVQDVHMHMQAADLLLTKAGASTLSEALACSLPLIIISALPGQEEVNARHFERLGVALWARQPSAVPAFVDELASPTSQRRLAMAEARRALARPDASLEIARHVLQRGQAVTAVPAPLFGVHRLQPRALRELALARRQSWLG